AGRKEVLDLLVDRRRIVERHRLVGFVELVCACCDIVNGPGTVIFTVFFVCARRNCRSRSWTGCLRRTFPVTRGTGIGLPLRLSAEPGFSVSTPSSAVANRFE